MQARGPADARRRCQRGRVCGASHTLIIPFATSLDSDASYASYMHLILKHVVISDIKFRDDEARERTRTSFACECAFYRKDAQRRRDEVFVGKEFGKGEGKGGGGGNFPPTTHDRWPIPSAYLVEGDEASDEFTLIIDDARGSGGCVGVVVAASSVAAMGLNPQRMGRDC